MDPFHFGLRDSVGFGGWGLPVRYLLEGPWGYLLAARGGRGNSEEREGFIEERMEKCPPRVQGRRIKDSTEAFTTLDIPPHSLPLTVAAETPLDLGD